MPTGTQMTEPDEANFENLKWKKILDKAIVKFSTGQINFTPDEFMALCNAFCSPDNYRPLDPENLVAVLELAYEKLKQYEGIEVSMKAVRKAREQQAEV